MTTVPTPDDATDPTHDEQVDDHAGAERAMPSTDASPAATDRDGQGDDAGSAAATETPVPDDPPDVATADPAPPADPALSAGAAPSGDAGPGEAAYAQEASAAEDAGGPASAEVGPGPAAVLQEAAPAAEASTEEPAAVPDDDVDVGAADDSADDHHHDDDDDHDDDDHDHDDDVVEASPEAVPAPGAREQKPKKPKPQGPAPAEVARTIGTTSERAIAYVRAPDPKLQRLSRKVKENLITELPPVTAAALLGPAALARHFIASAATGRYRDLFALWDLFVQEPDECRPVLAARQRALERARRKMHTAVRIGMRGRADHVAADVRSARGLIWAWLREELESVRGAIPHRPEVLAAVLERDPGFGVEAPSDPSERWLAEAARAKDAGGLPPELDELLGRHADRLPATIATLQMAHERYPERVPAILDRVSLDAPDIRAMMAWARDHGFADQLRSRIVADVEEAAERDVADGLARWKAWQDRGVALDLPARLRATDPTTLDLAQPGTAELLAELQRAGTPLDAQQLLDGAAAQNRMQAEKTYANFVVAGLDVRLPMALEGNPMIPEERRCPSCQAWTWARPDLDKRCPREGCPLRAHEQRTTTG